VEVLDNGADYCCWVVKTGGDLHAFGTCLMHSNNVRLFLRRQVPSLHNVGIFYKKIVELIRLGIVELRRSTLVVRKLDGCGKRRIFIGGYYICIDQRILRCSPMLYLRYLNVKVGCCRASNLVEGYI
jgi:hypothetical protein